MKNHLLSTTVAFAPVDTAGGGRQPTRHRRPVVINENAEPDSREDRRTRARRDRPRVRRAEGNDDGNDDGDDERRRRNDQQNRKRAERKKRLRHAISDNPLRLYRPSRLAALLDTDETTIWRWARDGVLPPPVQVAGIKGWTHEMIRKLLEVES